MATRDTRSILAGEIEAGVVYDFGYYCDTPGPDADEGTVRGTWTGEVDTWGKLTILPDGGGEPLYLFPREIVELSRVEAPVGPTPCPWAYGPDEEGFPGALRVYHAGTRQSVCDGVHSEADARLLAAAPDLLAACAEPIPSALPGGTLADDLFTIAGILEDTEYGGVAKRLRDKARQIHAAILKAKGG